MIGESLWREGGERLCPQDRWRTSAVEVRVGAFVIGKNVYTNAPQRNPEILRDDYKSRFWRTNRNTRGNNVSTYTDGRVFSSPFYIGRVRGNMITRVGINHPTVQDVFQNGFHLLIGSPLFRAPENSFDYRLFIQHRFYSPFTLY